MEISILRILYKSCSQRLTSWISCQDLRKILNSWVYWKDFRFYLDILNFLVKSWISSWMSRQDLGRSGKISARYSRCRTSGCQWKQELCTIVISITIVYYEKQNSSMSKLCFPKSTCQSTGDGIIRPLQNQPLFINGAYRATFFEIFFLCHRRISLRFLNCFRLQQHISKT